MAGKKTITTHTDQYGNQQTAVRSEGKFDEKGGLGDVAAPVAFDWDERLDPDQYDPDFDDQYDADLASLVHPDDTEAVKRLDKGGEAGLRRWVTPSQLRDRHTMFNPDASKIDRDAAAVRHISRVLASKSRQKNLNPQQAHEAAMESIELAIRAKRSQMLDKYVKENPDDKEGVRFDYRPEIHALVTKDAGLIIISHNRASHNVAYPSSISQLDAKAHAKLGVAREHFQKEHGRDWNTAERTAAVEDVNKEFEPGNRPHVGWQDTNVNVGSVDERINPSDDSSGYRYEGAMGDSTYDPAVNIGARDTSLVEGTRGDEIINNPASRKRFSARNRKQAYSTYAEATHAPSLREQKLSKEGSARARSVVAGYPGGVSALATKIQNGDERRPQVIGAFFAPFARKPLDMSADDRDYLVDLMASNHGSRSESLWGSALDESTK